MTLVPFQQQMRIPDARDRLTTAEDVARVGFAIIY